ncbi:major facilitator superfamily domain-containing protein [Irpex lacteus]|nr:major facilitator superfamily domain-containing protein [Irpex lacteus]
MDGVGEKPAWAWIFILEGLVTIILSIVSFFVIQDFPDTAKFLDEKERTLIIRRLQTDGRHSAGGRNWQTWVGMFLLGGTDGALYAFSLFLPSIINQVCFTATPANLLTVPVYAVACGVTWWGYIVLIASRTLRYPMLPCTLRRAASIQHPNTNAWVSKNVEGGYKRSVTVAMMVGFANLNGAVTSNVYRAQDAPWDTLGHGIILMYISIAIISAALYRWLLKKENGRRDRKREDLLKNGCYPTSRKSRREG